MTSGPLLAYALNGAPLTLEQGSPLRLLVPGWYGVSNVKWLSHIRLQSERFLGKWQARWYRTLWSEEIGGETVWHETEVSRLRVKSAIARVTRVGDRHEVLGFVLHDGTPLRGVQVKVDDGAWQAATLDPSTNGQYSWKLFRFTWTGAAAGRAHPGVPRHGRERQRAADERRAVGHQADRSRGQLAVPENRDDRLTLRSRWKFR